MARKRRARLLLVVGAILCLPGALSVLVFASGWADADALRAAPICPTPSRDASSSCLGVFDGTILQRIPGSTRFLPQVEIAVGDSIFTVGYDCVGPLNGACWSLFERGTQVATGWWKGQLVAFGPPGARPAVITDLSPEEHLGLQAYLLGLVIPAASLVLAGLLLFQAPESVNELIEKALAQHPDPPRTVDQGLTLRVAWGYFTWPAYIAWAVLYLIPVMFLLLGSDQYRGAPLDLVSTFAIAFAPTALLAPLYLFYLVRTSARRTIVVRQIEAGLGKGANETKVSYELLDGRTATRMLDPSWNGKVNSGDRLDSFTNPRTGSIRRLLSAPPAQG